MGDLKPKQQQRDPASSLFPVGWGRPLHTARHQMRLLRARARPGWQPEPRPPAPAVHLPCHAEPAETPFAQGAGLRNGTSTLAKENQGRGNDAQPL